MHTDTIFLSASGLATPQGITDPNLFEIQIEHATLASPKRAILLLDSFKFGVSSPTPIVPLESLQFLITDKGAPEEYLKLIRAMGIEVFIAKLAGHASVAMRIDILFHLG